MSEYPTVYNQNKDDDDKEGGLGMDLFDDPEDEAEEKGQKSVEKAAK